MINLLLCGNEKVFDGALTELISITNRTQETIKCYIFTAELTRIKPEYTAITDEQIEFLQDVIKLYVDTYSTDDLSANDKECIQSLIGFNF